MKGYTHNSNQFPVPVKIKPCSYTLTYNGLLVVGNCVYGICVSSKNNLIRSGSHKAEGFKINPNY